MLFLIFKIFSSLQGHLPFSVHFFLHFYGVTFFGTPNMTCVSLASTNVNDNSKAATFSAFYTFYNSIAIIAIYSDIPLAFAMKAPFITNQLTRWR